MAVWDDGYVTDTVYTTQFYRETTPIWLSTVAMLLGHRTPDLGRPFRYADLGCGNGLTALVVAATCPHAEIWGFDFNPAHVEFASDIAARAGLTNARFVEQSFEALAAGAGADAPPPFDFMVSHGVLSWISAANRRHLIGAFGRYLRPGGLAYVSYNTAAGAAAVGPLRTLMRLAADATPGRSDLAVPGILDLVDRLRQGGALYFQTNGTLDARLRDMRAQNPRYVAHEYLNREWHPLMFADVADAMDEAKCAFIGSATLSENIEATSVPFGVAGLLAEAKTQRLRETIRDLGSAQSFRRDIYRRGALPALPGEQQARLDGFRLASTGHAIGDDVTINTALGPLTGRADLYKPLLERLQAGPATLPDLMRTLPFSAAEVLQAATLLLGAGFAHPMLPAPVTQAAEARTRALNQVIGKLNSNGGEITALAAASMGTAISCDVMETLVVSALLDGTPPADLAAQTLARLSLGGRNMQRDGAPVTDRAEAAELVATTVQGILANRREVWRRTSILP